MSRTCASIVVALFACAAWTAEPSFAQSDWEMGLKGGANSTKLRGDQVSLFLREPGFDLAGAVGDYLGGGAIGGFVTRHFSDAVALQVELLYTRKGGKGNVFGTADVEYPGNVVRTADIDGELTVRLDYIEVPVLAKFKFPADDRVDLFALAGLAGAVSTNAKTRLEGQARVALPNGSSEIRQFDQTADISSIASAFDLGGVVGLGFEIQKERLNLLFDARWTFGIVSIDDSGNGANVWNSALSFLFGVGFPVGG